MAYLIGILSPKEAKELERRGWKLEEPPSVMVPEDYQKLRENGFLFAMIWVDQTLFKAMDGPDWDKGPKT